MTTTTNIQTEDAAIVVKSLEQSIELMIKSKRTKRSERITLPIEVACSLHEKLEEHIHLAR